MKSVDEILKVIHELSEDEQEQVLNSLLAEHYRDDLFDLCKYLLQYADLSWETHRGIVEALEAETKRKLVVVPRGCFKSTIAVVGFTIQQIIKNFNIRILIDSELYGNSSKFLREIKAHLMSPRLVDLYGKFESPVIWNEGEILINQRTVARKEATVTCGGVGTTKVGQHYDLIIGDDYNSPDNSDTPEKCQKVIDHYKYNLSILEPGGTYVLIGTRYAEQDITGFVLRELLDLPKLAEGEFDEKEIKQLCA